MRPNNIVQILSALILPLPALASTADAVAPANSPFALVSPGTATRLNDQSASVEAKSIIKAARDGLSKPPSPIPVLHVEGTLPHQGLWDVSIKALDDWALMRNFALANALTGEKPFADAAERFFVAWLDVYKPSFNPIDETTLANLILANDLSGRNFSSSTREKIAVFLRATAEGYLEKIARQKAAGKEDKYNWQSHRIKIIVLATFALGDENLIARAQDAFRRQVEVNIASDGEVADYTRRDALHYVVYDLEPLAVCGLAAKAHGQDWLLAPAPRGSCVASALDWLTPFALGEKTHQEFVHSSVTFDAERAKAGLKGYSGQWEPTQSTGLFQIAAILDHKCQAVLDHVLAGGGRRQDWLTLCDRAAW